MNYFGFVITVFISISFISSSPYPSGSTIVNCEITANVYSEVAAISKTVDDKERIAQIFEGCDALVYCDEAFNLLHKLVRKGKSECFKFLFNLIGVKRIPAQNISWLLKDAVFYGHIDIADFMLSTGFKLEHKFWFWRSSKNSPRNVESLKKLISAHPEYVAGLSPIDKDNAVINSLEEGLVLIELARYCDEISGLKKFQSTDFLRAVLLTNFRLDDRELAKVITHFLFEEGVDMSKELLDKFNERHPDYTRCREILLSYLEFENQPKEPGME